MAGGRKPIIGLIGGIGAGKSFVAGLLGQLGCIVIDSDAVARHAWLDAAVRRSLVPLLRDRGIDPTDRRAVARAMFADTTLRRAVEAVIHPFIHSHRNGIMQAGAADPHVRAFVWDSPLLLEAGLGGECDAILFVDTPQSVRQNRVRSRGWDAGELARRESAQLPLEEKRRRATDVIDGTSDAQAMQTQLTELLKRLGVL